MNSLAGVLAAITPPDAEAMAAARERQDRMTKPRGSLGALEEVSVRLAGLAGSCPPPLPEPACVAVFAADHGVHAQGVSPWPQEVTAQMVANFLAGGAVVNAFAAQAGAEVTVVDIGVAADLEPAAGLLPRKVGHGTADFTEGPAMTRDQAMAALVYERYREALSGDIRMNCDVCVYRIAMPGFEHRVGAPQHPHDHPHDPAHSHAHG